MSGATPAVKAVWTDFGGVLTPPVVSTMMAFCERTGIDPAPFGRAIWKVTRSFGTTDMMEPLDTPLVSEQDWLRQVTDTMLADDGVRVELTSMGDAWFDGREANAAWIDALRRVRSRGIFVGMLSNMPPAWDRHWRRMVQVDSLFDDVLLSFQVGLRKPAREIFDLAAGRAGVDAAECLFVDALVKNCAGAEAAGWRAIEFTDTDEAVVQLEQLLARTAVGPRTG